MSKKMKIFTAGALGIMMAGLVCTNVYALDNKDVGKQSFYGRYE